MSRQQVTGPDTLFIPAGQTSTSGQYFASKTPATWSVTVQNDGALDPEDYSVMISSSGLLTITLLPGAMIPSTGVSMSLVVSASSGNGNGNNDSLIVSVQVDADAVPCFAAGTMIETEVGARPVEQLELGDQVITLNGQLMPIRWIGSRTLDSATLKRCPNLKPVLIKRSAFGEGLPNKDLYVSPQHRIFVSGWRAELLFGESDVFVPAIHLVNEKSIIRDNSNKQVSYFHFATEEHQVVFANSLPAETLYPGDVALSAVSRSAAQELKMIFPELEDVSGQLSPSLYTTCLRGREAQVLAHSI